MRVSPVIADRMPKEEREEKMELERQKIMNDQEALALLYAALAEGTGLSEQPR